MVLIKENVIVGSKAQQTTYYWRGTRKYRHPPGKYRKIQSRTTIVLLGCIGEDRIKSFLDFWVFFQAGFSRNLLSSRFESSSYQ